MTTQRMKGSTYTLRDGEWDVDATPEKPATPPPQPRVNPATLRRPDAATRATIQARIDLLTDLLMPLEKVSQ